tara:strand:- start:3681 stop:4967 length:1287 start_codon:yes stop_codon:yes gene_type:complete
MATSTVLNLTTDKIRKMKWDGRSRDIRWDSSRQAPSGFGIRVTKTNRKQFVLQYRPVVYDGGVLRPQRNKRILKQLGEWGEVKSLYSLDNARKEAWELYNEVTKTVKVEEKWITLNEFVPMYMAHKKAEGIAQKSLYDIQRRLENYLVEPFGDLPLREIRRSDLIKLLVSIKDGTGSVSGRPAPIEHNRLLVHLSNLYKVAETLEKIPLGFAYPTRLIKKVKEKPRKLFLEDHKLLALYASLKDEKDENALYVIQILIHQGMRKEEVLGLRWCDVNLDRVPGRACEPPHLFVGEAKNGDPLFSALSPQAISIFQHLQTLRTDINDAAPVFPGRSAEEPLKDIRYPWERLRKACGIEEFTVHDLRHCVGTWLDRLGYSELRIGRVLNHRIKSVTQSYSRTANTEKEKTMIDLANWIEKTVGAPILRERQ